MRNRERASYFLVYYLKWQCSRHIPHLAQCDSVLASPPFSLLLYSIDQGIFKHTHPLSNPHSIHTGNPNKHSHPNGADRDEVLLEHLGALTTEGSSSPHVPSSLITVVRYCRSSGLITVVRYRMRSTVVWGRLLDTESSWHCVRQLSDGMDQSPCHRPDPQTTEKRTQT